MGCRGSAITHATAAYPRTPTTLQAQHPARLAVIFESTLSICLWLPLHRQLPLPRSKQHRMQSLCLLSRAISKGVRFVAPFDSIPGLLHATKFLGFLCAPWPQQYAKPCAQVALRTSTYAPLREKGDNFNVVTSRCQGSRASGVLGGGTSVYGASGATRACLRDLLVVCPL